MAKVKVKNVVIKTTGSVKITPREEFIKNEKEANDESKTK